MPDMNLATGPLGRFENVGGDPTSITDDPKVGSRCSRQPEMESCRCERDARRARDGRICTSAGKEVPTAVEAKCDARVRRVRLSGDAGPKQ